MTALFKPFVTEIIRKYGIEILAQSRKFVSILKDMTCNESLQETAAIANILKTPVPWHEAEGKLFKSRNGFIDKIVSNCFNTEDSNAHEFITLIADALFEAGLIDFSDVEKNCSIIPPDIDPVKVPIKLLSFDDALIKVLNEYGNKILLNHQRCIAFLMDYTGDEYIEDVLDFRDFSKSDMFKSHYSRYAENKNIFSLVKLIKNNMRTAPYLDRALLNVAKDFKQAISDYEKALSIDNSIICPKIAQAYLGRALSHNLNIDYQKTINDYEKAISLDANISVKKHTKIAQAYLNHAFLNFNSNYQQAITDYKIAKGIDENIYNAKMEARIYLNRALSNMKKDFKKAVTDYKAAKCIDENIYDSRIEVRINLTCTLSYNLDTYYQQAISDYEKALSIDNSISCPEIAQAYLGRALSYNLNIDYQKAISDYEKANDIDKNIHSTQIALAYLNRAVSYLKNNIHETIDDQETISNTDREYKRLLQRNAIKNYEKAISIDNTINNSRIIPLAYLYLYRSFSYDIDVNYQQAITDYENAVSLDRNASAEKHAKMAQAYLNRSLSNLATDYQQAITDYETAKDIDENIYDSRIEARIHLNRALSYNLDTDYQQTITDYENAILLDRNTSAEKHAKMAQAYLNRSLSNLATDYQQAMSDYKTAKSIDENIYDSRIEARIYLNRALSYNLDTDYQQAITDYENAVLLDRNASAEKHAKMAQAYLNRSLSNLATDYQQAITDYETAKGIDENIYDSRIEARIYLNRALSYNLDTDYQQAIASYEKAVSLDPNISTISTENHANIAQTYLKYALSIIDTDYHQAIDNYEKAVSLDPNISTEKHANIAQAYYNKGIGEEFNEEYGKNMARINYEKAIALYPRRYKEAEKALKSLNRNDGSFITTLLRKLLKESTAARIV